MVDTQVTEKTDDDHQIDDAMINSARLEHDPSKLASAQLSKAQSDSKRMTQTLDSCQYCLDNMTKHLIIAVHKNVSMCIGFMLDQVVTIFNRSC